jgi:uncharacterized protein involved in exopolysaccharide biosynthesis
MNEQTGKVPTDQDEINLLEIIHIIVKRKAFIIKVCGAAFVLSVIVSLLLPSVYTATAKVLPPQKEGGGNLSALLGQAGGLAGLAGLAGGLGGGTDLYVAILKSRSVADAVIQRLDLAKVYKAEKPEDTRKVLEGKVKFTSSPKEGIITIDASDKDPERAAKLANAFVDELGKASVRLNITKAGSEKTFLAKRLAVAKEDLRKAEEDMRAFSQQHKVVQVDSQAKASIEGVARLRGELASQEIKLSALRSYQTDESPEVRLLQSAIKKLRGELAAYGGAGGEGEGIPSIGSIPQLGLEYLRRMRELKTQEAIYEQLTKQYEVAKLSEAKDVASIQVLDEPVVPTKRSKPKRLVIVLAATTTAFFVAISCVLIERYMQRLSSDDRQLWMEIGNQFFSFRDAFRKRVP